MAVEDITKCITSGARKEVTKIEKEAQAEAKKTVDQYRSEAQKIAERIVKEAREEAVAEKKRALGLARLSSRDKLLAEKQAGLESVFSGALERLLSLPDNQYRKLIKKMLLEVVSSAGGEVIFSSRDKKRLGPSFVKEVNQALEKKGEKGCLKVALETREIKGGFIIRSGHIEGNNSLDIIIEAQREELEPQVLQMLFPSKRKG